MVGFSESKETQVPSFWRVWREGVTNREARASHFL